MSDFAALFAKKKETKQTHRVVAVDALQEESQRQTRLKYESPGEFNISPLLLAGPEDSEWIDDDVVDDDDDDETETGRLAGLKIRDMDTEIEEEESEVIEENLLVETEHKGWKRQEVIDEDVDTAETNTDVPEKASDLNKQDRPTGEYPSIAEAVEKPQEKKQKEEDDENGKWTVVETAAAAPKPYVPPNRRPQENKDTPPETTKTLMDSLRNFTSNVKIAGQKLPKKRVKGRVPASIATTVAPENDTPDDAKSQPAAEQISTELSVVSEMVESQQKGEEQQQAGASITTAVQASDVLPSVTKYLPPNRRQQTGILGTTRASQDDATPPAWSKLNIESTPVPASDPPPSDLKYIPPHRRRAPGKF